MSHSPDEIFELYKTKKIDKKSALDYLITFIEHSDDDEVRIKSIKYINHFDINVKAMELYDFMEFLLVSDTNLNVRGLAGHFIIINYFQKGKKLINWAFDNEKEQFCFRYLIYGLSKALENEALMMLVNLAYRFKKGPLINIIIRAIANSPINKDVLFDVLLNEYWKKEKITISSSRNGDYECETLLITLVKEAIEKVFVMVFFGRNTEGKNRAKKFLEQRDPKIHQVWGLTTPREMLYSASALSQKCFELFKEKTAANFDFLTSQYEYPPADWSYPYLNNQALKYLKEIIVDIFLVDDHNLKWTFKVYEKFKDKAYLLSDYVLELYYLCLDRFIEQEVITPEVFGKLLTLIYQYRIKSKEKNFRKIRALKRLTKDFPAEMEHVVQKVIAKDQSMKVLAKLFVFIENSELIWKNKALKAYKVRMSKKYSIVEEESIAIFRINSIVLPGRMLSRGYKEDYLSYSTEKKHISKLNLNKCNLEVFLQEILVFKNLKVLKLDNNKLRKLPRSILKLKKLELLNLKNNKFLKIPDFLKESSIETIF